MAIDPTPRFQLPRYTNGQDLHPTRTDFNGRMELIDELAAIALQGTRADRPMPETRGRFYAATDTRDLFYDTGTTWLEVARIGAGGPGSTVLVGGSTVQADEGTSDRAARADHVHRIPLATANSPGAQSAEDRAKMLGATNVSTPNTHVVRDADGRTRFADPSAVTDAANKRYVDTQINTRAAASHTHTAADTTSGTFAPARLPIATSTEPGAMPASDRDSMIKATGNLEGGTLMRRYAGGQTNVGTPSNPTHAANKEYVDQQITEHRHNAADTTSGTFDPARLPAATTSAQGAQSTNHYNLLEGAVGGVTPGALVRRYTSGQANFPEPSASLHVANKTYVDQLRSEAIKDMGQIGTSTHLNTVTTEGDYFQSQSGSVTTANGYPVNGSAGKLSVRRFNTNTSWRIQTWTEWSSGRTWNRGTNGTWQSWVESARVTDIADYTALNYGEAARSLKWGGVRGTNLNNLTEPGIYALLEVSANKPFPGVGVMICLPTERTDQAVQMAFELTSNQFWHRTLHHTAGWRNWTQVGTPA